MGSIKNKEGRAKKKGKKKKKNKEKRQQNINKHRPASLLLRWVSRPWRMDFLQEFHQCLLWSVLLVHQLQVD